eukprot:1385969-Amorphochlora_amoeboformis.AAC.1
MHMGVHKQAAGTHADTQNANKCAVHEKRETYLGRCPADFCFRWAVFEGDVPQAQLGNCIDLRLPCCHRSFRPPPVRPTVLSSREVTTRTASPVNLHQFHQMRNVPLPGTAGTATSRCEC